MTDLKLHYFHSGKLKLYVCCSVSDYNESGDDVISKPVLFGMGETEHSALEDFNFKQALQDNSGLDNIYYV